METIPGHLERLPDGGDRFQAEQLTRGPRERLLTAMADLVAKRGYQGTTIALIVKRAGVSRATFYEYFENREDCLLRGFDDAEAELRRRIGEAAAAAGEEWPQQVCAGLAAFLDYAASNPALARTCLIESVTAGPAGMERYEEALKDFVPYFAEGRAARGAKGDLPDTLEEMVVGGLVWMAHQQILRNETEELRDLLPVMVEFALTPYLGEEPTAELVSRL